MKELKSKLPFRQCVAVLFSLLLSYGVSWFIFNGSLTYPALHYDDAVYYSSNPLVQNGLTVKNIKMAFTESATNLWHPLTWWSLQLDSELGAGSSYTPKLTNILLLGSIGVCLFTFFRQLKLPYLLSIVFMIFWLSHPSRVESVVWISERKGLLATLFLLLSAVFFIKTLHREYKEEGIKKKTSFFYGISIVCYLLSLLAKSSAVGLCLIPLIFYIYRHCKKGEKLPKSDLVFSCLYIILASLVSLINIHYQSTGENRVKMGVSEALGGFVDGGASLVHYIKTLVYHPYPVPTYLLPEIPIILTALLGLLLCATALYIYINSEKLQYIAVGFIVILLAWLPVSGIISLGWIWAADRYTSFIHFGVLIALVPVVKKFKYTSFTLFILVIGMNSFLSYRYQKQWCDDATLFNYAYKHSNHPMAALNYSAALIRAGNSKDALLYAKVFNEVNPNDTTGILTLAASYNRTDQPQLAMKTLFPLYAKLPTLSIEKRALALNEFGLVFISERRYEKALPFIEQAFLLEPDNLQYRNNLKSLKDVIGRD